MYLGSQLKSHYKIVMVATEMFKSYRNISPPIFSEIFYGCYINYNLRFNSEFSVPDVSTAKKYRDFTQFSGVAIARNYAEIVPFHKVSTPGN